MASYKRKLKDASGNYVLPATRASCVYMYSSGNKTLDGEFNSLLEKVNGKASKLDCWPVGAIYMAIGGPSPASMFGGSWNQIVGKFIRAKNSSQDSGSTGGNNNVTLQPANIPTLSMQVGLTSAGYVNSNKVIQSFIMNNKIGPLGNEGMESKGCSGDPSDKQPGASDYGVGYRASSLVRYYNSNVKAFTAMPEYINVNCWQRVS